MTILEYIKEFYPITQNVLNVVRDPAQAVMERDDLPCDAVMYIDGAYHKVVYINDAGEFITVDSLFEYSPEEIERMPPCDLKETWTAYMENVIIEDIDILTLSKYGKLYIEQWKKKGMVNQDVYDSIKERKTE